MKIYDISQEFLTAEIYPGDPCPALTRDMSMDRGDLYTVSSFSACCHNGTHVDAPSHFIAGGKNVGDMDISKTVGKAFVAECQGMIGEKEAEDILKKAKAHGLEAAKRILIKGDATVTKDAANTFYRGGVSLLGAESQSVGPINAPMEVHKILLSAEVVLLEGVRLSEVSEGEYFLFAAPINIGIAEGSPCRAVLVDFEA